MALPFRVALPAPRESASAFGPDAAFPTMRSVLGRTGAENALPGISQVMERLAPGGWGAIGQFFGDFSSQFGGFGAVGAPFDPGKLGGQWGQAASAINAAAGKYGIPANFLAAVINRESSGNWSRDGRRYVYLPDRRHNILPYVGMTDPAVRQFGIDPRTLVGNLPGQVDVLARNLRRIFDQYGDWVTVANVHYSGDPSGRSTPGDSWQYGSTSQSTNMIMNFWRRLEPGLNTRAAGAGSSFGGATGDLIGTMLGGGTARISQEMGLTSFAQKHLNGMYAYSTNYGVTGHAGLDISLNLGMPLRSPVAGTVIKAGGTGYYKDDRYGNRAGTGELRIKLDNGDEIILGHMGSIGVRVGQRVTPGMMVGLSGTANGGHVHLEYRQWAPGSTPSGYRAIDPRQLGASTGASAAAAFGQQPQLSGPSSPYRAGSAFGAGLAKLVWGG